MRQRRHTTTTEVVSAALCQWVVCQLALADYHKSVPAVMLARLLRCWRGGIGRGSG